jgi:hypothetical protein
MSGVTAIVYLLKNNGTLTASVSASNIKAGVIPVNAVLPAIGVTEVSDVDAFRKVATGANEFAMSRIQVTVMAKTYPSKKAILELVRLACPNQRGTINGVYVDSIMSEGAGPDFDDEEKFIYIQSRDFMVKFTT